MLDPQDDAPPPSAPEPPADSLPGDFETDDDALILWMLSLTPKQRLEVAQGFVDSVWALRNGRSD